MLQEIKNTKIVCTLGPASSSPEILEAMVRAGMNVARLNFSHGKYEQFEEIIKNIRAISKKLDQPIAILQDLQGPKIRIAQAPEAGIAVEKDELITLTTNLKNADTGKKSPIIPIDYTQLHQEVKKGDMLLVDDGLIELAVEKVTGTEIACRCVNQGVIHSRKGVNVPTTTLSLPSMTEKDHQDLEFGLSQDVDFVALSFVQTAKDIYELRKIIKAKKSKARVMAKIETRQAVTNLEEIIKIADAIMIARGDLGIEIPAEQVPLVQKQAIHLCNEYGKPVITATHMLNSMVENPRATRAEISDAANAIFDNSDALMLSNETAVGKYPVQAVETLARVAVATEKNIQKHPHLFPQRKRNQELQISNATCMNAAQLAEDIKAHFIVAVSLTGFTAQHIAKHRIYRPLITITTTEKVKDQLALSWGCKQIFVERINFKNIPAEVESLLKKEKIAKVGDEVVIVVNASKEQKLISTIVIQ